jgi:hypothetical protein
MEMILLLLDPLLTTKKKSLTTLIKTQEKEAKVCILEEWKKSMEQATQIELNLQDFKMKNIFEMLNETVGDNAYGSATLTTQGIGGSRFTKTGRPPGIWEAEDLPIVAKRLKDVFDQVGDSEFWKNHFKSKYGIPFPTNLKDINKEQALAMNKFGTHMKQNQNESNADFEVGYKDGDTAIISMDDKTAMKLKSKPTVTKIKNLTTMAKLKGENKKSKDSLMEDYLKSREGVNLMEQMDKHRKRPKLMEGAMKRFFKAFDGGSTDEELVHEYAREGLTVPEAFVSKARKQWESLKKAKLDLELSEKEAKGFRQVQTTDPTNVMGMEPQSEEKHLASGLFN